MVKSKMSLEERFNKEVERQFKEQFSHEDLEAYIRQEFGTIKKKLVLQYLGISESCHSLSFTQNSKVKNLIQDFSVLAKDLINSLGLDDIQLTDKEKVELSKEYRRIYKEELQDWVEDEARRAAKNKFFSVIDELDIEDANE